jgi:hypothetical protein
VVTGERGITEDGIAGKRLDAMPWR